MGTFLAGKPQMAVRDGRLQIGSEGSMQKFVQQVGQRSFSGALASARSQPVLYATERCVLELELDGLGLTEIAPGIDLERDILAHMAFHPVMKQAPRQQSVPGTVPQPIDPGAV